MPGTVVNAENEEKKMQALIDCDPALAQFAKEWDEEYESRKKLVLASKETELAQRGLGELSGLDYSAGQRVVRM